MPAMFLISSPTCCTATGPPPKRFTRNTWLAALAGIDALDVERGELRGWIFGIARRQVALHFRRLGQNRLEVARRRHAAASLTDDGSLLPLDVIGAIERGDAVRAALAELGRKPAAFCWANMSTAAASTSWPHQFGRSPKAIESLLSSAALTDAPVARLVFRHRERHEGFESMTEPANQPDPEIDTVAAAGLGCAKRPMAVRQPTTDPAACAASGHCQRRGTLLERLASPVPARPAAAIRFRCGRARGLRSFGRGIASRSAASPRRSRWPARCSWHCTPAAALGDGADGQRVAGGHIVQLPIDRVEHPHQ